MWGALCPLKINFQEEVRIMSNNCECSNNNWECSNNNWECSNIDKRSTIDNSILFIIAIAFIVVASNKMNFFR